MAGCQDYDEDIRKVNDQLNANTAELTSITDALDKAIKDLEAKMVADYATKKALADLSAELKAEIDADVAAAKTALEAAYKAADAALKSGYEAADAALKAELQNKINEAVKAAQDANDALADTFEKALNQMKGSIDETNSMINDVVVPYFQGEIAKINTAITALQAADLKNADDIAKVAADLATAKTELTAAYEAAIKTATDKLQAEITKNSEAIAALTTLHKNDVALLQAAIALGDEDVMRALNLTKAELQEHIADYKATVDLLQGAMAEGDEAVRQQLTNALNAHIEVYETTVDQLQGAMAEGDEAVRQELKNALNALDELHKADVETLQAAIAENTTLAEGIQIQLLNHIQTYEATIEQLENQVTTNEAEITALKVRMLALETLHAADMENVQNVLNNLEVAIQQEAALRKLADEEVKAEINAVIDQIKNTDTNQQFEIDFLKAYAAELQAAVDANAAAIAAAEGRISTLETTVATIQTNVAELQEKVANIEEVHAQDVADLQGAIAENYTLIEKMMRELVDIKADINTIAARIQSIVYVPEYSDGKATIDFAIVAPEYEDGKILVDSETQELPLAFIPVKNTLRFKVNSTSETAVADLVEAYEADPAILSFDLEGVTVRGASAGDAALEIVGAYEDEDGYLAVEVLARNFDNEFYASTLACVFEKEMEFGPLDDEEAEMWKEHLQGVWQYATQYPGTKGYSAALVLNQTDEKTNVASEFTNLIAGNEFELINVKVVDREGENITGLGYGESEPVKNLAYDLDPEEEVSVLKDHKLMFVLDDEEYTTEEMIEMGYGVQLERRLNTVSGGNKGTFLVDLKPQVREVGPFGIWEDPIKSIETEGNTYVTLREGKMSKEEYLKLKKAQENNLKIKYLYDINGLDIWTESGVEITNRLVNVNLGVKVPWTLETALKTVADGKLYQAPVAATFEYDLSDPNVVNKSLEGYSLYSIVKAATETSYVPAGTPISLSVSDETITATLKNGSKSYAFPVNNNDDKVDYNAYTVVKKAEFQDLTIVVKVTVELGEQAPEQVVSKDVTFTTQNGADGWLFGYWNAVEDAYKQFLAAGYVGYTNNPETGKAKFVEAFANTSSYTNRADYLMVNDEAGIPQNVNIPFTANNNEEGNHKFQLWHEQLVDVNEDGVFDNDAQEIVQKVGPYFGIPFTFVVNATVDIPDYALDLDPVRVKNNIVNVFGEIAGKVGEGGIYTVDVSDLAKYYYVVNKSGVRDLKAVNAKDNVTVKFDLISKSKDAEGNVETGFEFQNEPGVVTNTLAVDWTSSEPYILPMGDAVATWGTYNSTEIGVVATLYVNGFEITTKEITLVTKDPLVVSFANVDVTINNTNGTNNTTTAYIFKNFKVTSSVEPKVPNLFDVNATTLDKIFAKSFADKTYGAEIHAEYMRVYYKDEAGNIVPWDKSKIILGKRANGEFDGSITIKGDDGNIQTPIYVDVRVKMSHKIHAAGGVCESTGDVTVTFNPAK